MSVLECLCSSERSTKWLNWNESSSLCPKKCWRNNSASGHSKSPPTSSWSTQQWHLRCSALDAGFHTNTIPEITTQETCSRKKVGDNVCRHPGAKTCTKVSWPIWGSNKGLRGCIWAQGWRARKENLAKFTFLGLWRQKCQIGLCLSTQEVRWTMYELFPPQSVQYESLNATTTF